MTKNQKLGDADYRTDYAKGTWRVINFSDGQEKEVITIAITQDSLKEPDETFLVLLSNPTGGSSLGSQVQSIVTIKDDGDVAQAVNPNQPIVTEDERISSLLAQRFGFGKDTIGGAEGVMTEITSLTDGSLLKAITDNVARWIYFDKKLDGQTWNVPSGSISIGPNKTIDGRDVNLKWQYGIPNNRVSINLGPIRTPAKTAQFNARHGQLIIVGITHVGDLGWPYVYQSPYFTNGNTDGLEIWGGSNYWIHDNKFMRMSDESLGVYHVNGGNPDLITFSKNNFFQTKTASLIGAGGTDKKRGRITIAYNRYNTMVNGRSPGEFRNMDAHVFNNVVGYVNDEGVRVGVKARVITEGNVFDMGCDSGTSGPRVIRYVLPAEKPHGVLFASNDFVDPVSKDCPYTLDEGFITAPAERPFNIPYDYNLFKTREDVLSFVGQAE